MVYLKRKKKRFFVKVISDHTGTFPAVTVEHLGQEWIVGLHELVSAEEVKGEQDAIRAKQIESVQDIVGAFKGGYDTFGSIARVLNTKQVRILSRCRLAERLGMIKLKRTRHEFKPAVFKPAEVKPSQGEQGTPLPNLQVG